MPLIFRFTWQRRRSELPSSAAHCNTSGSTLKELSFPNWSLPKVQITGFGGDSGIWSPCRPEGQKKKGHEVASFLRNHVANLNCMFRQTAEFGWSFLLCTWESSSGLWCGQTCAARPLIWYLGWVAKQPTGTRRQQRKDVCCHLTVLWRSATSDLVALLILEFYRVSKRWASVPSSDSEVYPTGQGNPNSSKSNSTSWPSWILSWNLGLSSRAGLQTKLILVWSLLKQVPGSEETIVDQQVSPRKGSI